MNSVSQSGSPALPIAVYAVFRHELRVLLYSPLTYVFQIGFLTILTVCIFLIADFFDTDEASARLLLVFLPWIALIFVPALAMRAWAEESGDRGFELAATLPLGVPALVLGKFFAGVLLLLLTLIFSAAFPLSVAYLGEPDPGALAASYAAAALLLCAFYAVALFGSALARDQTGAFVVAAVFLFALLLLGWDAAARLLPQTGAARDILAVYSPKGWLDTIGRGRVQLGAVLYFVLLCALALAAAGMLIVHRRTATARPSAWLLRNGVLLAGCLLLIPPQLDRLHWSWDVTAEREFTLNEGTVRVARRLPDDVELVFYWSATQTEVPQSIRSHARRVRDLLRAVARQAGGKLQLEEVDPRPDTDAELSAIAAGVRRIPMTSGDYFYLGAAVRHADKQTQVGYFDLRRDRLAEYDIAVLLHNLTRDRTPRVGVISPLLAPGTAMQDREGLAFMSELRRAYDLAVIPYFSADLPDDLDVLLVINPGVLKKDMLRAIDAFVLGGGGLIAMLDPFVRFDPASNQLNPQPSEAVNDLSDLLLAYGARYIHDTVVGDAVNAAPVQGMGENLGHYPYWLRLTSGSLSPAHPVTAALNELLLAEAGAFRFETGARANVLVTSGTASAARARADFSASTPAELAFDFAGGENEAVLAGVLQGPFTSAFASAEDAPPEHDGGAVFVIGDVDWLFDPFSVQAVAIGGQSILRPLNDNLAFLLNMIEFAAGEPALISIRSRGQVQRPFTRVIAALQTASEQYRDQEAELAQQISVAEAQISAFAERLGISDVSRMPAELRAEIQRVQRELLPLRRALRDVRRAVRESVDALSSRLTLINLLCGPLLVVAFFFAVRLARRMAARSI